MISFLKKITQSARKKYLHIILGVSLVLFIAVIGILSYFRSEEQRLAEKIYPNVFIDSEQVSEKTKKEALEQLKPQTKDLSALAFEMYYNEQPVATISASEIDVQWNGRSVIEKAYAVGRDENASSRLRQKVSSLLGLTEHRFETSYIFDQKMAKEYIASVSARYNRDPKNALFEIEDSRVVAFREDEPGKRIQDEKILKTISKVITQLNGESYTPTTERLSLTEEIIEAEITLEKTNDLGIEELIGVGESDYTGSIASRVHNLTLATTKFHGVIIPQGEEISFNEIIGDISVNTGYKQAYIIQNGKTVLGDGGGVCQVSTTLFRAGLNTGLPITERHAHAYRVGYYENDSQPGFDATIFSPYVDLKMKNDTPADILIQTEIDEENNLLYFRFYGRKDDRNIEISEANVYDVAPPPPAKHEDDPTLPKGQVKQIDFAAPGAKANFTYKVTRGDKVIQDTNFFSSYKPWAAVYLVGTKE
jgi:vancomycin resistance protein YoaR